MHTEFVDRSAVFNLVVKIISKRDNLAIKLGYALDAEKYRTAYGDANDKTSENVSWKFVPLWDNNRVYFKIVYIFRHQHLKVGKKTDGEGDHSAYGTDSADTFRHQWYLKPASHEDNTLFYIYNRQCNQGLKLGIGSIAMVTDECTRMLAKLKANPRSSAGQSLPSIKQMTIVNQTQLPNYRQ